MLYKSNNFIFYFYDCYNFTIIYYAAFNILDFVVEKYKQWRIIRMLRMTNIQ